MTLPEVMLRERDTGAYMPHDPFVSSPKAGKLSYGLETRTVSPSGERETGPGVRPVRCLWAQTLKLWASGNREATLHGSQKRVGTTKLQRRSREGLLPPYTRGSAPQRPGNRKATKRAVA